MELSHKGCALFVCFRAHNLVVYYCTVHLTPGVNSLRAGAAHVPWSATGILPQGECKDGAPDEPRVGSPVTHGCVPDTGIAYPPGAKEGDGDVDEGHARRRVHGPGPAFHLAGLRRGLRRGLRPAPCLQAEAGRRGAKRKQCGWGRCRVLTCESLWRGLCLWAFSKATPERPALTRARGTRVPAPTRCAGGHARHGRPAGGRAHRFDRHQQGREYKTVGPPLESTERLDKQTRCKGRGPSPLADSAASAALTHREAHKRHAGTHAHTGAADSTTHATRGQSQSKAAVSSTSGGYQSRLVRAAP